jgi:phenylacetate-CoA ligase
MVKAYGWFLRHVLQRAGDAAMGHPMVERLAFLERAQWWSEEQIEDYRRAQLRGLMAAAVEVPFYREHFERSRVLPGEIQTPADLRRLPAVTKEQLRANYPDRTVRPTGQRTYETSTSGSTGLNFRLREDRATAGWYRAAFLLALEWAGWRMGDSHLQTGISPDRGTEQRIKDLLFRCAYFSAYDLSDEALDRALETLDRKRISHLWGYPGSLDCLARRAQARGFNRPLTSLVTWGDSLQSGQRARIESAFQGRVFDTYGCGEGIQVAAQCGTGAGYHLYSLDVIVDYVDDDGVPVPPGTPGNLLLTRLHPGPMPFIRYRVGDVATSAAGRACSCGRAWEMLDSIQGRTADAVLTPGGNRLIVHFFTGVLEHFTEIDQFQIVQDRVDAITLRVVPTPAWSNQSEPRIVAALHRRGAGLDVHIEKVNAIPLTSGGKRRFVVSNLPAGTGA